MRNTMKAVLSSFVILLAAIPAFGQKKKTTAYDAPTISCAPGSTATSINLEITAGASGAPAGVSVQWILASELQALGGIWPSDSLVDPNVSSFCKASFSGNASGYSYSFGPGQTISVTLGDVLFDTPGASSPCENVPLSCGEQYAFRSFAHATSTTNRSAWSNTTVCSTMSCTADDGCTYTQGYWKTHGPVPTGNNANEWPVTGLTLGSVSYTDFELQAIFNTPAGGNGLVSLAHQLMAAKLNVANGADDTAIAAAIASADALIGSLVVPPVGSGSLAPGVTSALTATLTAYNEGATGPGHCD